MKKPITVAFLPIYQNPYQHLLTESLHEIGVDVLHLKKLPTTSWLRKNRQSLDVLHLHWLSGLYMGRFITPLTSILFLVRIFLAQRLGYKIVWTAHNILPHKLPFPPMHRLIRRFVMRRADAVIVHCEYAKAELLRNFPRTRPIFVIAHGNYDGIHPIVTTRSEARSVLTIAEKCFVYLLIGNISPYKGIDTFLDAFQNSADQDDVAIIAGRNRSPAIVTHIEELAKHDNRIRLFPGFISEDRMQLYFQAADVAFFAFNEILTSGTVLLALTHGLPIVAPAMGCLPEIVGPNAGLLYDPGQPDSIGNAIQESKKLDLSDMRKSSRRIADRLNWGKIALNTLEVYQSCINES